MNRRLEAPSMCVSSIDIRLVHEFTVKPVITLLPPYASSTAASTTTCTAHIVNDTPWDISHSPCNITAVLDTSAFTCLTKYILSSYRRHRPNTLCDSHRLCTWIAKHGKCADRRHRSDHVACDSEPVPHLQVDQNSGLRLDSHLDRPL